MQISVSDLASRYAGSTEFALIDPREEGIFTRGHLLGASNLPFSRLELLIERTVPRLGTELILCDDGDGTAARAQAMLERLGYTNVKQLAGGVSAWALNGYHLFSGVNLIGKAFGEHLEKSAHTPSISATELHKLLNSDTPVYLLDGRTPAEHRNFCIPGALSCPNGEMVYRALPSAPADATVVVHCAGRTRSILGAQTLIEAGIKNKVVALENGTMDWIFADLELEHGANRPLDQPQTSSNAALAAAQKMAESAGAEEVDLTTLDAWRNDETTLYLFDVRSLEEFAHGHLEGARSVPGGQLVQNVDRYIVTRNARTVLIDTDGVRAKASAHWLARMGFKNIHTLTADAAQFATPSPAPQEDLCETVSLAQLAQMSGPVLADCRRSVAYRRGHIPGAWFLTRARLEQDALNLPEGDLVLITDDNAYARLIARDLGKPGRRIDLLDGGMTVWKAQDGPIETGLTHLASTPDDAHLNGGDLDDPAQVKREFRRYLDWEIALIDMMDGDPAAIWMD